MSFYLRKEWVDQRDGIEKVSIHYAVTQLAQQPHWKEQGQVRELIPEWGHRRKRRAKVIKLPRNLDGKENYLLHYYFRTVDWDGKTCETEPFVEEIVCNDTFTFVDHWGCYTNICLYWSINSWGAFNYSSMFEDGTRLDHPLSSLHYYGHAHDGWYIYERYEYLRSLPLPHIFRGRAHGPKGARVDYCFHIARVGSPFGDDWDFWDNNEGLNYFTVLK
jgi:hypothetical protein